MYALALGTAAIICFYASKKGTNNRKLWFSVGFAMTSWFVKSSILASYSILESHTKELPLATSSFLMIGYIPLVVYVLSNIGKVDLSFTSEKKRYLAGIYMIDLAVFLLILELVLIPYWDARDYHNVIAQTTASMTIVLDWLILTILLFAFHKELRQRFSGWFTLALMAAIGNVISDIPFYFYGQTANPVTINLGSITAILISLAALDATTSAIDEILQKLRPVSLKASTMSRLKWHTLILPAAALLCVPATWILQAIRQYGTGNIVLEVISILIIILAVYRSYLFTLENQSLAKNIRIDGLTGLYNHRHFQENLAKAIVASNIAKQPLSLVVFDLDNFSNINNMKGHLFGDKVLETIGDSVKDLIRYNDEAFRIGGDEFAIIMPNTNPDVATAVAENIKAGILRTVSFLVVNLSFTVSMGISCYPTIAKSKEQLFNTADGALYWIKYNGKNDILVFDPDVVESLSADERARKAESQLFMEMVNSLAETVDAKDSYTMQHSKNVSEMAGNIARAAGFSEEAVRKIEAAGILHDIGKIGVPDNILNKPGRLTNDEMLIIRNHPVTSSHIIESTSLKDLAQIIRAHHERWDGMGYPDGLKGNEIPVESRILALADTFDAMTTDRPYRKGCSIDEAVAEVKKCAGSQFDPEFAQTFVSMFSENSSLSIKKQAL
jgi:diguanylate cyclase (GGDEF)-like protein/putative nucleotidyltransferase with HDIG domain